MTDIELRKADALKGLDECPYIPCSISMTKERCDTIRELLQPSPDSEVEEALEYFKQNNPSLFVNDETCGRIVHAKHLQTLIKKAQQPRQEWIPDIQALAQLWTRNYQKATHLPTDTDTLDEVIQEGLEKLFGETRQQPLPEPPKEK